MRSFDQFGEHPGKDTCHSDAAQPSSLLEDAQAPTALGVETAIDRTGAASGTDSQQQLAIGPLSEPTEYSEPDDLDEIFKNLGMDFSSFNALDPPDILQRVPGDVLKSLCRYGDYAASYWELLQAVLPGKPKLRRYLVSLQSKKGDVTDTEHKALVDAVAKLQPYRIGLTLETLTWALKFYYLRNAVLHSQTRPLRRQNKGELLRNMYKRDLAAVDTDAVGKDPRSSDKFREMIDVVRRCNLRESVNEQEEVTIKILHPNMMENVKIKEGKKHVSHRSEEDPARASEHQ